MFLRTECEVDNIWAEAVELYKKGEKLYLDDTTLSKLAKEEQNKHLELSPLQGTIEMFLDVLLPENWDKLDIYERRNFIWIKVGSSIVSSIFESVKNLLGTLFSSIGNVFSNLFNNLFNNKSKSYNQAENAGKSIAKKYIDGYNSIINRQKLNRIPVNLNRQLAEVSNIANYKTNNVTLNVNFNLNDNLDNATAITTIDKQSLAESGKYTYYLLNNNVVTPDKYDKNRVLPVRHVYEYFEYNPDDKYYTDEYSQSLSIANDKLKTKKNNYLIEIEMKKDSKIINIRDLKIGNRFKLLLVHGGIINTVLTGFEETKDNFGNILLFFGNSQINLTQIIATRG